MGWQEMKANLQGTAKRTYKETVLYTPQGLAAISVIGIFREPFVGVDLSAEMEITSEQPTLDVQLADLPQAPSALPGGLGDRLVLVRTSIRYRVVNAQNDGEGMTKLFLQEQVSG
jgi:hypothetical protein